MESATGGLLLRFTPAGNVIKVYLEVRSVWDAPGWCSH